MIYMNHRRGEHDSYGLDDLDLVVRKTAKALRPVLDQFDSIAVNSGMSGVLVGVPVSMRLHKPLVIFRKPGDDNHASRDTINVAALGTRALFLDDLVATGKTRKYVAEKVRLHDAELVGEYLYDENDPDIYPEGALRMGQGAFRRDRSGSVPF